MTAKEGATFLKLHQETGIEVHSNHPIVITASEDITFSGKTIAMSAGESLRFMCGFSSLVLDGITDIQGQIVEMDGSIKAPVSISTSSEDDDDEDEDLEQGLDVMGMIPLAGGGA